MLSPDLALRTRVTAPPEGRGSHALLCPYLAFPPPLPPALALWAPALVSPSALTLHKNIIGDALSEQCLGMEIGAGYPHAPPTPHISQQPHT